MTESQKKIIRMFAAGEHSLRESAVSIYRMHLSPYKDWETSYRSIPEMQFMSEIDNPCPDLLLRNHYRKIILGRDNE